MRSSQLPFVAIVGRPNVGKSTLFNRYAGWRRAIVENVAGLTRDCIAEEVEVEGRPVLLVDTAGLDSAAGRGLPAAIQAQAWAAVEDADAILFLVDGRAGLLPEDQQLAQTLRRSSKPTALAVNKIDLPQHEPLVGDFHSLGFETTVGVSAAHGRGAWEVLDALVDRIEVSDAALEDDPAETRIAVVGRPNVGKSSL
ncbi:MAG: GTPase, partial [Myxococcota bacterium]